MAKNLACIGLGSNQEDREKHITEALQAIGNIPGCQLDKISTLYETTAWGLKQQPDFLNAVCGLYCDLTPDNLLNKLQEIENHHCRDRTVRWGPRTLDLDIICFGDLACNSPTLTIPHPLFKERDFVLKPFAEIYPDLIIDEMTVQTHLENLVT